jgi:hypothetical protein
MSRGQWTLLLVFLALTGGFAALLLPELTRPVRPARSDPADRPLPPREPSAPRDPRANGPRVPTTPTAAGGAGAAVAQPEVPLVVEAPDRRSVVEGRCSASRAGGSCGATTARSRSSGRHRSVRRRARHRFARRRTRCARRAVMVGRRVRLEPRGRDRRDGGGPTGHPRPTCPFRGPAPTVVRPRGAPTRPAESSLTNRTWGSSSWPSAATNAVGRRCGWSSARTAWPPRRSSARGPSRGA